ncbi:protein polyglycylase TTLL10 [Boleophthalmus pectinirostris]|uniref:protein polyglycylase TTLL10 n=1 Tax=Boleophthalmus pectinirostris TaxID=150288 RepID=UPI00242BDF1F|nr:protein polyglycylase TTLL10 [Boleophthalmus pectinirostris]
MSPGAAEREQHEEEGGSEHPHQEQPCPPDPQTGQEVMSWAGKACRQRHGHERSAVSPMRRERTSVNSLPVCIRAVRARPLARSVSSYPFRRGHMEESRRPGPFYFFGGANGADIVCSYCESKGWTRIYNKQREDFKLKWCESRSKANYSSFRSGEQLIFQIPNNNVLTTKIGLLSSLREYERVSSKVKHGQGIRRLKMDEFIPTTYRMDMREERDAFFSMQEGLSKNQRHMWICKPTGLNQGRGIFLLKSPEDMSAFRHKLQEGEDSHKTPHHHRQPQARIVQKYIQNPLLLKGRKFDVRSYLIIACTTPYLVFFCHGYVRLTCDLFDLNTNNMATHLTNQYMQKKNPLYSELKEDTVWSMESFNAYVNDRLAVAKDLPRDWVLGLFTKRMQQIMTQCFLSVRAKLDCRLGFFDLFGCDFMVDEDFNVWLLEMNCNPALHTNCSVLQEVIPRVVHETLDLSLEIFNKCRRGQRILPLSSQKEFVLLFKGVFPPNAALPCNKSTPTHCDLPQKKSPKVEPTRWQPGLQIKSLEISEEVLAEGDGECLSAPALSVSPPQPTLNDSRP